MRVKFKKLISVLLIACIGLSMAGCELKPHKSVYQAADSIASAILTMDYKKIKKTPIDSLSNTEEDEITRICSLKSNDQVDTIRDSMSYKIDAGTLDASIFSDKASVIVEFTMLDWEAEKLSSADDITMRIKFNFSNTRNGWILNNTYDILNDVYEFADKLNYTVFGTDFFNTIPVDYFVSDGLSSEWWFADGVGQIDGMQEGVIYTDTTMIDLDVILNDNYVIDNIFYRVYYNGNLVYTSDSGNSMGYYGISQGAEMGSNGYLLPGTYSICFFNRMLDEELLIAVSTCEVLTTS